jgi:hypothetical protein
MLRLKDKNRRKLRLREKNRKKLPSHWLFLRRNKKKKKHG